MRATPFLFLILMISSWSILHLIYRKLDVNTLKSDYLAYLPEVTIWTATNHISPDLYWLLRPFSVIWNRITRKLYKQTWALTLRFSTQTLTFHLWQKFASHWLSLLDMIYTVFASQDYIRRKVICNSTASICYNYVSLLTHDESFAHECEDSDLNLIHIADRGGLKYPSAEVINAVITLWKILYRNKQDNCLMKKFVAGTSKTILIQLSISRIQFESFDFWRFELPSCRKTFFSYLSKILSAASNCLLKNKGRNLDSKRNLEKCNGGSKRKPQKLQSEYSYFIVCIAFVTVICSKRDNYHRHPPIL